MKKETQRISFRSAYASILVLISSIAGASDVDPIRYEALGKVEYLINEGRDLVFSREFQITVTDCDWRIQVSGAGAAGINYFEVVHKGDSIYRYTAMNHVRGVANNGTAVVEFGDVPPEDGSLANYVWLGLASACYFHAGLNRQLMPPWHASRKVQADWKILAGPPFLVEKATYYREAGLLPPPFDRGWKAGELTVVATTNIGRLIFPVEFIYESFKPRQGEQTAEAVQSQFQARTIVREIRLTSVDDVATPIMQSPTLVEERRFSTLPTGQSGVQYLTSSRQLEAAPQKGALDTHRKEMRAPAGLTSEAHSTGGRARSVVIMILILSAGFFALAIHRNIKTTKGIT